MCAIILAYKTEIETLLANSNEAAMSWPSIKLLHEIESHPGIKLVV